MTHRPIYRHYVGAVIFITSVIRSLIITIMTSTSAIAETALQGGLVMVKSIGVDLAGLLGDAWRAPKVGPCRVG